jgi:hypothetical protein
MVAASMNPALEPRRIIEKLFKVELKIANRKGEKIAPFILNSSQIELDDSTRGSTKHVILKARQLGISTYILARFLALCLTRQGVHAVIVSHERGATIKLLRRVKFMIEELRKSGFTVNVGYDSKQEITFPDFNSSLYIGTAGQKAFSRGDTVTHVHASEVAFWIEAANLMKGVMGALTPDAEVFLESTANGAGGYFYDVCQRSMAAHPLWKKYVQKSKVAPSTEWKFHFYPWTDEPLYRAALPQAAPIWTEDEQLLLKLGLTPEQVYWRRKKLDEYNTVEEFMAEFPLDPEEAFISTGACYFDKRAVLLYRKLCKDPVVTGRVDMVGQRAALNRFTGEDAPLSLWDYPRAGEGYVIGADVAEGVGDEGSDASVAQVLNRSTMKQVAVVDTRTHDPHEYAELLFALGAFYGWAWLAVESNGPGLATLLKLQELGYPRLYKHRRLDLTTGQEVEKLGWKTDQLTRTPMLTTLRQVLKGQRLHIVDERFLKECTTFCKQSDGQYRANSECHDDHVIALGVAIAAHQVLPMDVVEDTREMDRRGFYAPVQPPRSSSKTGY